MRCAIVEIATGTVTNVAEITPGDGSNPETGFQFLESDTANIGDTWDGEKFIAPPPPPE